MQCNEKVLVHYDILSKNFGEGVWLEMGVKLKLQFFLQKVYDGAYTCYRVLGLEHGPLGQYLGHHSDEKFLMLHKYSR